MELARAVKTAVTMDACPAGVYVAMAPISIVQVASSVAPEGAVHPLEEPVVGVHRVTLTNSAVVGSVSQILQHVVGVQRVPVTKSAVMVSGVSQKLQHVVGLVTIVRVERRAAQEIIPAVKKGIHAVLIARIAAPPADAVTTLRRRIHFVGCPK